MSADPRVVSAAALARLAARDLLHQRLASMVLVVSLAAVLTPLLVLFGLKFGVIDNLVRRLVEDPANREIRLIGHGRFDAGWFERLAAREEVAFVAPRTRGAAATLELRSPPPEAQRAVVELVPTGPGDPLLGGYAPVPASPEQVVLSAPAARALGLGPGDVAKGTVRRKRSGRWERASVALEVVGVVPDHRYARPAAFVLPPLLADVEDYRDGYAVEARGWPGERPFTGERVYSGFRLYVRRLDDVARVRDLLMAGRPGFEVATKAKAIEEVRLLDRYLTATYLILSATAALGYALSFGASMWVNVERKRRELGVLQLLGFRAAVVMLFPVVQSALVALAGAALAIALFWAISALINDYFARQAGLFEGLCRLLPSHLAAGVALTLACAVAASALAAYRTTRIEPSSSLREL